MKLPAIPSIVLPALTGAGLWTFAGSHLGASGAFDFEPNPLGIHRSPYGSTIAMALQSPIDRDWHGVLEVHGIADHGGHDDCEHDHDCGHAGCGHDHDETAETETAPLVDRLEGLVAERTNPLPPTPAHQLYIRRQIDRKLRFAYQLDPSHYGNYNAYHHFLIDGQAEMTDADRSERQAFAERLATQTIRYCLAENADPRPALTAASAAYNRLELALLAPPGNGDAPELAERLAVLDLSLARHRELLEASLHSGLLERLSDQRREEMLQRGRFLHKLREAAATTLERRRHSQASAN